MPERLQANDYVQMHLLLPRDRHSDQIAELLCVLQLDPVHQLEEHLVLLHTARYHQVNTAGNYYQIPALRT